jgi:hypothetical protein
MGFVFSLLGYVACVCATIAVIIGSFDFIFPDPPDKRPPSIEISAQKQSAAAHSGRDVMRRLADMAAARQ